MKRTFALIALAFLILVVGHGGQSYSATYLAAAPHRWSLLQWEASNFLDKWWHRTVQAIPWYSPPVPPEEAVARFFELTEQIDHLQVYPDHPDNDLQATLQDLQSQRDDVKPVAEEQLEKEISRVLDEEVFQSRIGLIWPPVDLALLNPPSVLITSPRHVIERLRDHVLEPNLNIPTREMLEEKLLQEEDLSALVVNIGGIATYPSIVVINGGLRRAVDIAAHEWLHHYWFFHPLGQNYFRDADTTTLNESAANLAGREISQRALDVLDPQTPAPASPPPSAADAGPVFDFRQTMHETRLRVDELLAEGRINEAEAYMESRRQLFVDNGYRIRKINQAYFAFHGTYADSPSSVSPIYDELVQFREALPTLGDFIREIAKFSSYSQFKTHLQTLQPPPTPSAYFPIAPVPQWLPPTCHSERSEESHRPTLGAPFHILCPCVLLGHCYPSYLYFLDKMTAMASGSVDKRYH